MAPSICVLKQLKEIATTRVGVTLRRSLEVDPTGWMSVVQAKDIGEHGELMRNGIVSTKSVALHGDHQLRPGDVLIQSRGIRYRAAVVGDGNEKMIAASPLYVIRVKAHEIDPAFLVHILRSRVVQAHLRREATGTHVPQVSRAVFDNLAVPVPSLDVQRKIVDATELVEQERDVSAKLCDLRMELIHEFLFGPTETEAEEAVAD
jgi:type I restriction modification DNA specificity protein